MLMHTPTHDTQPQTARTADFDPPSWECLHPNARHAMRLFTALGFMLPIAPAVAVVLIAWDGSGLSVLAKLSLFVFALIGAAILGWLIGGARYNRTSYALDAGGLRIRRGMIWRSETCVPRSRVQHTDINRGPLDRRLGLTTLKVFTAGTRLASVSLDGLPAERAEELRDALVNHADDAL